MKPLSSFPLLEGELQTAEAINPRVTRGGHSPRAALSARVPDASNSTQSGAATTRIFVVDDHPFFRDGLLAWIEVRTAEEERAASLSLLSSSRGTVEVHDLVAVPA